MPALERTSKRAVRRETDDSVCSDRKRLRVTTSSHNELACDSGISTWARVIKRRCRNWARAFDSIPSRVSAIRSRYASEGRVRAGTGAPELGITGVDLAFV